MTRLLRLTLLAVFVLGVGSLVIGGFGAKQLPTHHSPYASALSDLSVRPAEAIPCSQTACIFIDRPGTQHDHWECTPQDISHCWLAADRSTCTTMYPCP